MRALLFIPSTILCYLLLGDYCNSSENGRSNFRFDSLEFILHMHCLQSAISKLKSDEVNFLL